MFFHEVLILSLLTLQAVIFGLTDELTLDKKRLLNNRYSIDF